MLVFMIVYWLIFYGATYFIGFPVGFTLNGIDTLEWWKDYPNVWPIYFVALQVALFVLWPRFRQYVLFKIKFTVGLLIIGVAFLTIVTIFLKLRG